MNEILQQKIEEAARRYCQDKNYILPDDTKLSLEALTAIDAYIEAAKSILKNQWISVEEALPPLDDGMESVSIEVVVKNEYGKATCAWYSYITNTWHLSYGEIAGDDLIDSKITHWAMIPTINNEEK